MISLENTVRDAFSKKDFGWVARGIERLLDEVERGALAIQELQGSLEKLEAWVRKERLSRYTLIHILQKEHYSTVRRIHRYMNLSTLELPYKDYPLEHVVHAAVAPSDEAWQELSCQLQELLSEPEFPETFERMERMLEKKGDSGSSQSLFYQLSVRNPLLAAEIAERCAPSTLDRPVHGSGMRPLHHACGHGNIRLVMALLRREANLDGALEACVEAIAHKKVVHAVDQVIFEVLVESGANVNGRVSSGSSLLMECLSIGALGPWARTLLQQPALRLTGGELHVCAQITCLALLLAKGANPNEEWEVSGRRVTPAYSAVLSDRVWILDGLLKAGADPDLPSYNADGSPGPSAHQLALEGRIRSISLIENLKKSACPPAAKPLSPKVLLSADGEGAPAPHGETAS